MKILGLIPARGGSKGVPKKNIKLLGKKPLIEYTIDSARNSNYITDIIVSTDDDEIAIAAEIYGFKPPFIRPAELAQDNSTSLDVVKHAIAFFENQNIFFDAVCLLQPTTPFREKGFIDKAIEKFIATNADCLLSVLPIPDEYNPHWAFEENEKGMLKEGYLADIAVFSKNLLTCTPEEMLEAKVVYTVVGGKVVFSGQ